MFLKAIPDALKSNLESLGKEEFLRQFYLAGGTALALQLGHRVSYDLDFFTAEDFSEAKLISSLQRMGNVEINHRAEDTLLGALNSVKISFFWYRYPLLFPSVSFSGIRLADVRDIAAMKIDAIQSRGKKRDFIDLGILLGSFPLEELIGFFEKKYTGVKYNMQHILKSLLYFADAQEDEMPHMLKKTSWEEVKVLIENEVKKIEQKKIQ